MKKNKSDNITPLELRNLNLVLNKLFREKFDWFKKVEISETRPSNWVQFGQVILDGKIYVDSKWGNQQVENYILPSSRPSQDEELSFGEIIGPELDDELTEIIRSALSFIMGKTIPDYVSFYGLDTYLVDDENRNSLRESIKKTLLETQLPTYVRRRLQIDESSVTNLLKKFSYRLFEPNKKLDFLVSKICAYTAYELLDSITSEINDQEYNKLKTPVKEYLIEKYGDFIKNFINETFDSSGDEFGSRYVFEKHSERRGGNGFTQGYGTWNELLREYASWFPDLDWKELKMKLDNLDSGGKILIKKPGDIGNKYNYYFSLQRFDK